MAKGKKALSLTEGSVYRIISSGGEDGPVVTQGTYQGLTTVGQVDTLCIELDDAHEEMCGDIRLIPCDAVQYIDVISSIECEKQKKKEDPTSQYFG